MKRERIAFIGLGLIGGSIAMAIREKWPESRLYGHARHKSTIESAFHDGLIENDHLLDLAELAEADLIFLCSPVRVNIEYLKKLKPFLRNDTILTDVGSVKGDIHAAIRELDLADQFIGGHPMTGSEQIGYAHASSLYLENIYYILTAESEKMQSVMP